MNLTPFLVAAESIRPFPRDELLDRSAEDAQAARADLAGLEFAGPDPSVNGPAADVEQASRLVGAQHLLGGEAGLGRGWSLPSVLLLCGRHAYELNVSTYYFVSSFCIRDT